MAMASGACLALVVGAAGSAAGPLPSPDPSGGAGGVIARYQERIPQLMAEQGIPGLAVALVDGDRVLRTEGFGHTDRDGSPPTRAVRLRYVALAVTTVALVVQLAAWRLIGWGLT